MTQNTATMKVTVRKKEPQQGQKEAKAAEPQASVTGIWKNKTENDVQEAPKESNGTEKSTKEFIQVDMDEESGIVTFTLDKAYFGLDYNERGREFKKACAHIPKALLADVEPDTLWRQYSGWEAYSYHWVQEITFQPNADGDLRIVYDQYAPDFYSRPSQES